MSLPVPIRLTCVIHSLAGGGAERVMAGLTSRLSRRCTGVDFEYIVTLITLGDGSGDRHDVDPAVSRVDLNAASDADHPQTLPTRARRGVRRIWRLRRAIVRSRPDVVLSFCDRNNVLTLLAMMGRSVPIIVAERSDPAMQSLGPRLDRLRRTLYPRAARVVALTPTAAAALQSMSIGPVAVIPSAVEPPPQPIAPRAGTAQRTRRVVLGVGRLEYEKGFDRLIEAFAALAADDSPGHWTLRIVGEGSLRGQLQQQAEMLGIAGRVELPGWKRPIWPEYQAADLFVLPSRYEGFPSALMEAMAAGLPSIAVDCESGPREIIRHDQNGWLIDNDTDSLGRSLIRFARDPTAASRLSVAATSITRRYGWQRMVDAYDAVIRDVLGRAIDSHAAERPGGPGDPAG